MILIAWLAALAVGPVPGSADSVRFGTIGVA